MDRDIDRDGPKTGLRRTEALSKQVLVLIGRERSRDIFPRFSRDNDIEHEFCSIHSSRLSSK